MGCRPPCWMLGGLLLLAAETARAQGSAVVSGESRATAGRIAEARKHIEAKQYAEAVEELQGVLDSAATDLVTVDARHCVQARHLCHYYLARLPASALRDYRARVEPQARKRLEEAETRRDPRLLRRVVEEAFCTRAAARALDLLGDLAFEQGRFEEAEGWWARLVPPVGAKKRGEDAYALVHPDPEADKARVRAKQLLARRFRGVEVDLAAYEKEHKDAEGTLAGRKGKYADIVRAVPPPTPELAEGTTFGGDPTRGLVPPAPNRFLDRLAALTRDGPTYRLGLESRKVLTTDLPPPKAVPPTLAGRSFAFFPVLVAGKALVCDARYVTALDLRTGKVETWYDAARVLGLFDPDLTLPAPPDLRYTMTVADGCVYARLGVQELRPGADNDGSLLVCLGLEPDAKGGRLRWTLRANTGLKEAGVFEGAPVVHDGRLYAALTRFEGDKAVTSLHCYALDPSARIAPPLRWKQDVCEVRDVKAGEARYRHHLLSLSGRYLLYATHSGAVVALDAATGQRLWAVKYPPRPERGPDDPAPVSGLAPCLVAHGRVYVAPADSDRLLCLDLATGGLLWERENVEVVHLLGVVSNGGLVFTTPRGLRAVNATDGSDEGGWTLPDGAGRLPSLGRPLLMGNLVLWPTAGDVRPRRAGKTGVHGVVAIECSELPARLADAATLLQHIPSGNLAWGEGCLAVADRQVLSVFVPPAWLLEEREKEVKDDPKSARARLRLARSQADASKPEDALASYAAAGEQDEARRAFLSDATGLLPTLSDKQRVGVAVLWVNLTRSVRLAEIEAAEKAGRFGVVADLCRGLLTAGSDARLLVRLARAYEKQECWDAARDAWNRLEQGHGGEVLPELGFTRPIGPVREYVAARLRAAQYNPPPDDLPIPLAQSWQVDLAVGERVVPLHGSDVLPGGRRFLTVAGNRLTARQLTDGKTAWTTAIPFPPSWSAGHLDTALVGGEQGLACVRLDDGHPLWTFRPADGLLEGFRLVSGRVFVLFDLRQFVAVDAATGRVAWRRSAPGAGLPVDAPSGCFFPQFFTDGRTLLAQTGGGRRWLLDAETGRLLHEAPTPSTAWPSDPIPIGEGRVCLVENARLVRCLDLATGKGVWTHTLDQGSLLSGQPPQVVAKDGKLLLFVPLNIGFVMQRLDPATGKPLWSEPILLPAGPLHADHVALDTAAVYLGYSGTLVARSLLDGKLLWEKALEGPAGPWQVRRPRNRVVTHPVAMPAARFQFRWVGGSLQWLVGLPPSGGRRFAVVCCDPTSGKVLQRLTFEEDRVDTIAYQSHATSFLPGVKEWWRVGPGSAAQVRVVGRGLFVGLPTRLWGFQ